MPPDLAMSSVPEASPGSLLRVQYRGATFYLEFGLCKPYARTIMDRGDSSDTLLRFGSGARIAGAAMLRADTTSCVVRYEYSPTIERWSWKTGL
eukprot:COSAG01_NODE_14415_length_1456_cov_2.080324_1_plen_94_part_00